MTEYDWTRHLHRNEILLWQDRPDPPVRPVTALPLERGARVTLSVLLAALALTLVWIAAQARLTGLYAIPVVLLVAGLGFGIWFFNGGQPRWHRFWFLRRHYALTDRRAIEVTRFLGHDWKTSTPIERMDTPRIHVRDGLADLIYREFTVARRPGAHRQYHTFAFRYLHDAERPHRLITDMRAARTAG